MDDAGNESGLASAQGASGLGDQAPPSAAALLPVAPNPFNPTTTTTFDLAQAERVRLEVFDAAGRRIRVLLDDARTAGRHWVQWDGTDDHARALASGVCFCVMDAGSFHGTRRMALVR